MGSRRGFVKATAAAADLLRPRTDGLVVLIYHRIGQRTSAREIDLPRSLFSDQMAFLASHATVTTLDEALRRVADPGAEGPLVAVTFDDGTADFADVALPVLVKYRVPVTLYVATAFLDDGRSFPNGGVPLSWRALHDALTTGLVDVGSHTHNHALLHRLPPAVVREELTTSTLRIEDELGVKARHFAYPKAVPPSLDAEPVVRAHFASAALAGTRVNRYGATDPYRLARSPMQTSDGMRWFQAKVRGGMAFEDALRRVVRRRRYAASVS